MSIATLKSQSRRSTLSMRLLGTCLALGAAGVAAGLWYRHKTTPFPYSQRWMLEKDFPYLTRKRLCEVLSPQPGERILEIGPGIGFFSLPVAQRLTPGGMLNVIDIQQVMLEHTLRVAAEQNVSNIVATHGDAQNLPYSESTFDAAFMVTALGEIADHKAVLGELRRVLKPGGRLVVGEFLFDWHAIPFGLLRRRAERQGFRFEYRVGSPISYFARFSALEGRSMADETNA